MTIERQHCFRIIPAILCTKVPSEFAASFLPYCWRKWLCLQRSE